MNNNIAKIRYQKGITQEKLAEVLGTTPVTVSRYENSRRGLNSNTLERIARALDCSIVDLISDTPISANKDLKVTEMQHIIEICSDVIFQELKAHVVACL